MRVVGNVLNDISPSNIFQFMVWLEFFYQKNQAAFGHNEHNGLTMHDLS